MLRSVNELLGLSISAQDGDGGTLHDVYFDDVFWKIHYLIVDTGTWFSENRVLISPGMAGKPFSGFEKNLPVNLTVQQVKNSPKHDQAKPVSLQLTRNLVDYYRMQWQMLSGGMTQHSVPDFSDFAAARMVDKRIRHNRQNVEENHHLRSLREIRQYLIVAQNEIVGQFDDLIVNDELWHFSHLVSSPNSILPIGDKKTIATGRIKSLEWESAKIVLDISPEAFRELPPYDETRVRKNPVEAQQ